MARKRSHIKPDRDVPRGRGDHGDLSSRGSAISVLRTGQFYLESDSYSDAIVCFLRADEEVLRAQLSDADVASLHASLARCYFGLGKYDAARSCAEKLAALAARTGNSAAAAEANVILSRTEAKSGRFRKSLRAAEQAYAASH